MVEIGAAMFSYITYISRTNTTDGSTATLYMCMRAGHTVVKNELLRAVELIVNAPVAKIADFFYT